jgi:hypothetical protein
MEVGGGMAGCGIMHGGLVDAAVGWRVGGVGRAEGAFFESMVFSTAGLPKFFLSNVHI